MREVISEEKRTLWREFKNKLKVSIYVQKKLDFTEWRADNEIRESCEEGAFRHLDVKNILKCKNTILK